MTLLTDPSFLSAPDRRPDDAPVERWAAVGHAPGPDPEHAVVEAFTRLRLTGPPELLMVFASPTLDPSVVATTLGALAPGVATIGCTSRGEISTGGPLDESVVLMAVGGVGLRCATAMVPIVDGDVRAAAAEAARCVEGITRLSSTAMVLLVDGDGVDQDDIVRGAYDTVGPSVPLVGGCACGVSLEEGVTLFHQGAGATGVRPAGRAVVAAAISSSGPIGIGLGHGFSPVGEPHVVTSSGRNVVATLGERPALDAYLEHHGASDEVFAEPGAFAELARRRPLGIARRGRVEPRSVIGADPTARTLVVGASVPQGGVVWMMDGDVSSALGAIDAAAADALAALRGNTPVATLVFDCGARRGILGADGMRHEADRLVGTVGGPIAGFYTFGEIARTSGITGFHNLTAVLLAFG